MVVHESSTLQGTNISHSKGTFEDDFPFPEVGYVNFREGNFYRELFVLLLCELMLPRLTMHRTRWNDLDDDFEFEIRIYGRVVLYSL